MLGKSPAGETDELEGYCSFRQRLNEEEERMLNSSGLCSPFKVMGSGLPQPLQWGTGRPPPLTDTLNSSLLALYSLYELQQGQAG